MFKIIATILIAGLVGFCTPKAHALQFSDLKFGSSQFSDTQWNVYACIYTNTCQIYSLSGIGTSWNSGSPYHISSTQYIGFTASGNPTYPWDMKVYNSNGSVAADLGVGYLAVQGQDNAGHYFFFFTNANWNGTVFSLNYGFPNSNGFSFTGVNNPTVTQTNTMAGSGSSTTLGAGQTGGGSAPAAPTVVSTSTSVVVTTTVSGNTTYYYNQPVTITTYSDGSTTTTNNGSATLTGAQSTNSATITASQQSQVNSVRQRQNSLTPNSPSTVYIQQSGSGDIYNITQIGTGNTVDGATFNTSTGQTGYQTYAQFSGGSNSVIIRQGDPNTHAGKNIVDISVNGAGNYLNINQGTDANGLATGLDTGQHYEFVWVQGGNNNITSVQQSTNYQPQFGVITVNGTGNNIQQTQTGSASHQSFIGVQGSYNNIAVSQNGSTANQGNYSSVTASGNNNSATVTQTGANNNSNITLINAGSPASVNLTQTGGQSYGVTQTCYTAACGTITVRQGN